MFYQSSRHLTNKPKNPDHCEPTFTVVLSKNNILKGISTCKNHNQTSYTMSHIIDISSMLLNSNTETLTKKHKKHHFCCN